MQNFSNFLNHIETKRPCHSFNSSSNQHAIVGSTTHSLTDDDANDNIHSSDNNLNSNSNSNLTNSNGLYALYTFYPFMTQKIQYNLYP